MIFKNRYILPINLLFSPYFSLFNFSRRNSLVNLRCIFGNPSTKHNLWYIVIIQLLAD